MGYCVDHWWTQQEHQLNIFKLMCGYEPFSGSLSSLSWPPLCGAVQELKGEVATLASQPSYSALFHQSEWTIQRWCASDVLDPSVTQKILVRIRNTCTHNSNEPRAERACSWGAFTWRGFPCSSFLRLHTEIWMNEWILKGWMKNENEIYYLFTLMREESQVKYCLNTGYVSSTECQRCK